MKKPRFNYLKFIYDKGLYREFLIYFAYHPGVSKRRVAYWFLKTKGLVDACKRISDRYSFVHDPFVQKIVKEPWL